MELAPQPEIPKCLIEAIALLVEDNRILLRRANPLPQHWILAVNARAADTPYHFVVLPSGDAAFHAMPPPFALKLFEHLCESPSDDVAVVWPTLRRLCTSTASFESESEFLLTAMLCAAIEVTYLPRFTRDEHVERLERIASRCSELADALDWIDEYCAMPNGELWRSEIDGNLAQLGVSGSSIELFLRHSPTLARLLELLKWDVESRIQLAREGPQVRASRNDASVTRFRELLLLHLLSRFPEANHLQLATIAHGVTIAAFWDNTSPEVPDEPLSFGINLDAARAQLRRLLSRKNTGAEDRREQFEPFWGPDGIVKYKPD